MIRILESKRLSESLNNVIHQELHEAQLKLTRTCQALFAVLLHFERIVSVDMEREQVMVMSRLRNNVIVDSALAMPFVQWLRQNKDIPGGKNT